MIRVDQLGDNYHETFEMSFQLKIWRELQRTRSRNDLNKEVTEILIALREDLLQSIIKELSPTPPPAALISPYLIVRSVAEMLIKEKRY